MDLKYLDELHELHNDYPLASEKLEISHNMLSRYCINIADIYRIKIGGVNELVPNLGNKSKYVFHYKNLLLREKCSNTEFFLVRIFTHSDCIRRFTE